MQKELERLQELSAELDSLYDTRIAIRDTKIKDLERKLEQLGEVALDAIDYVGIANYHERISDAKASIHRFMG